MLLRPLPRWLVVAILEGNRMADVQMLSRFGRMHASSHDCTPSTLYPRKNVHPVCHVQHYRNANKTMLPLNAAAAYLLLGI